MKGQASSEQWKAVVGYEGLYEVSSLGRVRKGPRRGSGCVPGKILTLAVRGKRNSYVYLTLTKNNRHRKHYVHRLVAEAFVANPSHLPIINHKDGSKDNNDIGNLEWSSFSANLSHAYRSGLHPTKLSPKDVLQIRRLFNAGTPARDLADHYSVDPSTVHYVLKRAIWKHL
jgi:hypothetical protein